MKLYEITNDMRSLQTMADTGELTADDIKDTMEGLDIAFDQKAVAVLKVRQSMLAEVRTIEEEIERLVDLKKAPENSATRLGDYLKDGMLLVNKDKLDLGIFKLTLKKASKKLGEIDESKVPDDFWSIIPESKKLDKRALLKAVKESPIEGVELADSSRALIIK
jgi:hypothetical protein